MGEFAVSIGIGLAQQTGLGLIEAQLAQFRHAWIKFLLLDGQHLVAYGPTAPQDFLALLVHQALAQGQGSSCRKSPRHQQNQQLGLERKWGHEGGA